MMSLQGDELHYFVSGIGDQDNPSIKILNLSRTEDLHALDQLAKNHFSSVILSIYSPSKTIIPEGIFDQEHLQNYMEYNYGEAQRDCYFE